MAFCSFSREQSQSAQTAIDNNFITRYLPTADGTAVKIYLYGLYLCGKSEAFSAEAMAECLSVSIEEIKEAFLFWEDCGLVSVVSADPLTISYLRQTGEAVRRLKPEKYTAFNQALQALFPEREISVSEYGHYMAFLEEQPIRQDALLMIVQYCRDYTGDPNINFKYVRTTALNFIQKGILTPSQVEKELAFYSKDNDNLRALFRALGIKRKPELADSDYLKAWKELEFEFENVLFAATKLRRASMQKLDAIIRELYANHCFSKEEIECYLANREAALSETYTIAKKLGCYLSYAETYSERYTAPWMALGYTAEALDAIADYAFLVRKRSFEGMDELVRGWYEKGVVSLDSIREYLVSLNEVERFLKTLLEKWGLSRRPTLADHDAVRIWRNWGFSDEMILRAAEEAVGKGNPVPYTGAVLSSWKAKNILTPADLPARAINDAVLPAAQKRATTKEEMDALLAEVAKRYRE